MSLSSGETNSSRMSERILVTGADGFIGTHLLAALEKAGWPVDCHSMGDGDIADGELPYEGIRHVFHLAGKTFVPESWSSPRSFYKVNVLGTVNVLEFCRRQGASLTLMSSYVYGSPRRLPIAEDHPLEAFNPYSHTKILAEEVSRFYANQWGIPVTVIRPFNIYGPGQDSRFLIPLLIKQALDLQQPAITVADLRPRRDFLHVRDLVALLVLTISCRACAVYNAGSGLSTSVGELVALINDCAPKRKAVLCTEQRRENEVLDTVADIGKAGSELGWKPIIPLAEGIAEMVEWMKPTIVGKERS